MESNLITLGPFNPDEDVSSNIIELKHGKTFYDIIGKNNTGPWIVCLHGITWWSFVWTKLAEDLAKEDYRVLIFDFYGRGHSDCISSAYTPDLLTDQVLELLDKLEIKDNIILMGLSMGGLVASYFAAKHPDRISKLILIAPAIVPVTVPFLGRLITAPYIGDFLIWQFGKSMMLRRLQNRFKDDFIHMQEDNPKFIDALCERLEWSINKKEGFVKMFHSTLCNFPFAPGCLGKISDISSTDFPVLSMFGSLDALVPYQQALKIKDIHPKIEFITMEGGGHSFLLEDPTATSKHIRDFLKK